MVRSVSVAMLWLLSMVGVGACRDEQSPTVPLMPALAGSPGEARLAERSSGCGRPIIGPDVLDADARLEMVGEVIAALREGLCEPVDDARRLCRSLFLIGATDPLVGLGAGLDDLEIERMGAWHRWALADGVAAADTAGEEAAAAALRALERIDVSRALARQRVGGSASALADVAIERADQSIIGPLADVEARCL